VLPENCEDMLKTCLEKYGVNNMTSGKKTPIQERPLDFPQLQNMEVTYFETELNYPTTSQVLQEYLGQCCNIDQSFIIVRNPMEPQEQYQEETQDSEYVAKLTTEELESVDGQKEVGNNRVMDLLKENPSLGHITTFGGHPVIAAAGVATINTIKNSTIIKDTLKKEHLIREYLQHSLIKEIRGKGLMLAALVESSELAAKIIHRCLEKGIILFFLLFEGSAIRITPPLTITEAEIKEGCKIINEVLNELS
jgi:hypothetical protein